MVLLRIGTEKILKCGEIFTAGKEITSETEEVLDWGTAFVYILFWLIESRQGSQRLGSGSNSRGSLRRIGPSDFPPLPSTQKYIPPLSPSVVQKSGFLQTLWEGSNSKALAQLPTTMNPMGGLTTGMPYYAHRSYLWCQALPPLLIIGAFPYSDLFCLPGGTPADLLKKMAWYNFRRALLSKYKPCGNRPGQKLFLEAIELLKLGFLLNAVSQLTSCVWEQKWLGQSLSHFPGPIESPESTRKAFSSSVAHSTCVTYTQLPIFTKNVWTTLSLGFLLLC